MIKCNSRDNYILERTVVKNKRASITTFDVSMSGNDLSSCSWKKKKNKTKKRKK